MALRYFLLALVVFTTAAELKKRTIKNVCVKKTEARIKDCMRYVNIKQHKGKDFLKLSYSSLTWELVKAKEDGYHIRTCEKGKCKYWKDAGDKYYKWLTLSSEPESRFKFKYVKTIEHERLKVVSVVRGQPAWGKSLMPPVKEKVYTIEALTPSVKKYKYVTYNTNSWLLTDDDDWYWVVSPDSDLR